VLLTNKVQDVSTLDLPLSVVEQYQGHRRRVMIYKNVAQWAVSLPEPVTSQMYRLLAVLIVLVRFWIQLTASVIY
jgi:hypothetical protein